MIWDWEIIVKYFVCCCIFVGVCFQNGKLWKLCFICMGCMQLKNLFRRFFGVVILKDGWSNVWWCGFFIEIICRKILRSWIGIVFCMFVFKWWKLGGLGLSVLMFGLVSFVILGICIIMCGCGLCLFGFLFLSCFGGWVQIFFIGIFWMVILCLIFLVGVGWLDYIFVERFIRCRFGILKSIWMGDFGYWDVSLLYILSCWIILSWRVCLNQL